MLALGDGAGNGRCAVKQIVILTHTASNNLKCGEMARKDAVLHRNSAVAVAGERGMGGGNRCGKRGMQNLYRATMLQRGIATHIFSEEGIDDTAVSPHVHQRPTGLRRLVVEPLRIG